MFEQNLMKKFQNFLLQTYPFLTQYLCLKNMGLNQTDFMELVQAKSENHQ